MINLSATRNAEIQMESIGGIVGRLSTHVLDNVSGHPADGVVISLHRMDDRGSWAPVMQTKTNSDGRTDEPLLSGPSFRVGTFMLSFHIGDYFKRERAKAATPPFLDVVPIQFTIADPNGHYHVPLLATPWSYSTYRGS
jgi:hydroxyisourate hydrolase